MKPIYMAVAGGLVAYLVTTGKDKMRNGMLGAAAGYGVSLAMAKSTVLTPPAPEREELPQLLSEEVAPSTDTQATPSAEAAVFGPRETSEQVGADPFPVGAQALLEEAFESEGGKQIMHLLKSENGSWISQPAMDQVYESIGDAARSGVPVSAIVDAYDQPLWQPNMQALVTYP